MSDADDSARRVEHYPAATAEEALGVLYELLYFARFGAEYGAGHDIAWAREELAFLHDLTGNYVRQFAPPSVGVVRKDGTGVQE